MALIHVDGTGVGEYDANMGEMEAENYFEASGVSKKEVKKGGFVIWDIENGDYLGYRLVH